MGVKQLVTRRAVAATLAALAALAGAGAFAATAPGTSSVGGCGLFPHFGGLPGDPSADDLSAWNQDVSAAPLDPDSDRYLAAIAALGGNQAIHPDFGSNPGYGIPFLAVPRDQRRLPVSFRYRGESDPGPYPVPRWAPVEAGSDRHVLVVRRGACELYELFDARFQPRRQRWLAGSGAVFDLDRAAPLRPDGWTSADAAGLPILPGLVRYREVEAGAVEHAIRVTFAATRRAYVHPATHYASCHLDAGLPPMGARLRLGAAYYDAHLGDFPAGSQSRVVFEALHRYGMIVADNGSNWYITGGTDPRWRDNDLNRLKGIPADAFEFVRTEAEPVLGSPC